MNIMKKTLSILIVALGMILPQLAKTNLIRCSLTLPRPQ